MNGKQQRMEAINWTKLAQLRGLFLQERISDDYWRDPELLALYDHFLAKRISWKWQSVWEELQLRKILPSATDLHIIDWGCGTGAATRTSLAFVQAKQITLVDQSPSALAYAASKLSGAAQSIHTCTSLAKLPDGAPTLLLISHVINELSAKELKALTALAKGADYVIWIEPGSQLQSRTLVNIREELLLTHCALAPCTNQRQCPLVSAPSEQDWCHHFAKVPSKIFQDGVWSQFAKQMKIDLHRLPYSFLVAARTSEAPLETRFRRIGLTRFYKGFAKVQVCGDGKLWVQQINARKKADTFNELHNEAITFTAEQLF